MARITLNISKKYKDGFINNKIDNEKYFQLNMNNLTTRSDLYLFAIAIALVEKQEPTPLSKNGPSDTFVRTSYLNEYDTLLSALFFDKKIKDDTEKIDDICNWDDVYALAEEYANSGFSVLEKWSTEIDQEILMLKLIDYMDKQYEIIKDDIQKILVEQ